MVTQLYANHGKGAADGAGQSVSERRRETAEEFGFSENQRLSQFSR